MTNQSTGANRFWGSHTPPKSKAEFFDAITMPSPAGEGAIATIRLYGPIDSWGGWWGISASDVSDVLDALPDSVTRIILRINSPGGEVFEAMSILNMLRAHKATVLGVVDGLAASAGSVIAVGCDETVMSPGTQMMIHSPSTIVWGNAADMRKEAEVLDSVEESIISIYRDKAGESAWGELLSAETWYTAQQAVETGLADRVAVVKDAGETSTAGAEDDDLLDPLEGDTVEDKYQSARARLMKNRTGAIASVQTPSSTEPGNPTQKEALAMSDALKAGLSARLGVTDAEISDDDLLAAVDEVLSEQTDTPAAPAATVPGTQLIEDNVLAQMRADAAAGREAREQQIRDRRDGVIKNALKQGRISAASAPEFRAMLDANEEAAAKVIDSLAPNTVHVEEVGHSDTLTSADDSLYGSIFPTAKEA
ncbi:head maturation protease, ClpP-related [Microbacterium sp. MEJ108Y]|uniref:head maturation protease, ClpP-related n=1 Tax=Microbacterium sp. MEJ108Y TaxID=1587523 RepID=UPI0006967E2E|nr:head maturation protease, ClpP-related [Microbacterium sp. MEJ108Y]